MAKRDGTTEKISISVRPSVLTSLRKRADRLHGGNVSAVIAELAADAELLEGMHELVGLLGGPGLTDADRDLLDRAWAVQPPPSPKPARKRKPKRAA